MFHFRLKNKFRMSGVRLYVNRSEYSLDNPNDKLMFQMMSNFSEFDNTSKNRKNEKRKNIKG